MHVSKARKLQKLRYETQQVLNYLHINT